MLLLIWLTIINGSMSIIERARAELPEGKTIAHGFLTLSLLSLLVKEAVVLESDFKRGVNYGFNRVRFPSPVPAGSRIRVRCTLLSLEEVPGGIQICWGVAVEIESIFEARSGRRMARPILPVTTNCASRRTAIVPVCLLRLCASDTMNNFMAAQNR